VRESVPSSAIVSVALGELSDWLARRRTIEECSWERIDFRKLGLAHADPSWRHQWRELRARFQGESSGRPGGEPLWVAVAYLDWEAAWAPDPESVIGEAAAISDCPGVLFDTWDKTRRIPFDRTVARWIARAKEAGRFVALAGSLDEAAIRRLRPLAPDLFAVRGAACRGGDRNAPVERDRVARLVEAVG
jgi:hypothetical protein